VGLFLHLQNQNTPYDCGIILCKHRDEMVSTMQATGDYIQFSQQRDGMMYGPEMSRRARSIELWATLRYLGRNGLAELVDGFCDLAVSMAKQLKEHNFQILNEVVFNQILVSGDSEEETKLIIKNLQKSSELWLGSSIWNTQTAIRVSICSWATTDLDVKRSVEAFVRARDKN